MQSGHYIYRITCKNEPHSLHSQIAHRQQLRNMFVAQQEQRELPDTRASNHKWASKYGA